MIHLSCGGGLIENVLEESDQFFVLGVSGYLGTVFRSRHESLDAGNFFLEKLNLSTKAGLG